MIRKIFMLLVAGFVSVNISSQTITESFEKLAENYFNMKNRVYGFSGEINEVDNSKALSEYTESINLWEKINSEGSSSQKNTATILTVLVSHFYGVSLTLNKKTTSSEMVLVSFLDIMNKPPVESFPFSFEYKGVNNKITIDDFKLFQAQFYYYYAATLGSNFKFDQSISFYEKYLQHPNANDETKLKVIYEILFSNGKMKFMDANNSGVLTDEKIAMYVYKYLQLYYSVNATIQNTVIRNSQLKPLSILNYLLSINNIQTPSPQILNYVALIADMIAKYEKLSPEVLTLYHICFKNFKADAEYGNIYAFDKSLPAFKFENSAQEYALTLRKSSKEMAEFVGFKALKEMSLTTQSKCENYTIVADAYAKWGDKSAERTFKKQAETCYEVREKAERKKAISDFLYNNNLNAYLGVNVLPLFNTNPKRDYGGVVNFTINKFALEFSYLQIYRNKENIFDLWIKEVDNSSQDNISRWDGYYAHIQPKFFDSNQQTYVGFLLGFAQKIFDPMQVNITNIENSFVSSGNFNPSEKQYIAMLNYGGMLLKKGLGFDMYAGLGVTYNQFSHGFDQDVNKFLIDNPLLENRKSPYLGFIMRFGFNFGINLGAGND